MRRAEMARRRRNLSEKRNEEVKVSWWHAQKLTVPPHLTAALGRLLTPHHPASSKRRSTSSSRSRPARPTARASRPSARRAWTPTASGGPTLSSSAGPAPARASASPCPGRCWKALWAGSSQRARGRRALLAPRAWLRPGRWSRRSPECGEEGAEQERTQRGGGQGERGGTRPVGYSGAFCVISGLARPKETKKQMRGFRFALRATESLLFITL